MHKSYKIRFYPTQDQKKLLNLCFSAARWVYNETVETMRTCYYHYPLHGVKIQKRDVEDSKEWKIGDKVTVNDISTTLKILKEDPNYEWLTRVPATILFQSVNDCDKAFTAYFARIEENKKNPAKTKFVKYPKFKSRKDRNKSIRMQINNKNKNQYIANKLLKLYKIGKLKIKWPDNIPTDPDLYPKLVTISFKPDGTYWVSFMIKAEKEILKPKSRLIGIDLGCDDDFLVDSNGKSYKLPDSIKELEARIDQAQKKFSRQIPKSRRYRKQRTYIAKLYSKKTRILDDFLHNLSNDIVRNNDIICIENLDIKGMIAHNKSKSIKLGGAKPRTISRQGWYKFTTMLAYKADWQSKTIIIAPRFYPSSKMCSSCGNTKTMPTRIRVYDCPKCPVLMNRDLNSAKNLTNLIAMSDYGWKPKSEIAKKLLKKQQDNIVNISKIKKQKISN